jgi:lipid-binding SYLF domain-containing protein
MRYFKIPMIISVCVVMMAVGAAADWNVLKSRDSKNVAAVDGIDHTLEQMEQEYPAVSAYRDAAYAYAVFPKIKKAGLGVGGAQGHGIVFKDKKQIGKVRVRQLTVGFQGGLQAYSELIFFKDEGTFNKFKTGDTELNAQASAVVIKKGLAENTTYSDGLAVFTLTLKGLMYEATIGGQRLKYEPFKQ